MSFLFDNLSSNYVAEKTPQTVKDEIMFFQTWGIVTAFIVKLEVYQK